MVLPMNGVNKNGGLVKESGSRQLVLVTPELAARFLASLNGTNYRRAMRSVVRRYARLMREGKWRSGHPDAIQFDWFGNLGNGQHRLLAVIEAGVSVHMYVERGIDPEHFRVTDRHGIRTLGDQLTRGGFRTDVPHGKAAAVARAVVAGMRDKNVDDDVAEEFSLEHEDLIASFMIVLAHVKPNRAQVTAAFCKASFEFPTSAVLASAARYAAKRFTGVADPLSKLQDKVFSFVQHGGKAEHLYACAVAAVRADLESRSLKHLQPAMRDFMIPAEDGQPAPMGLPSGTQDGNVDAKTQEQLLAQEKRGPPPGPRSKPRFQGRDY